MTKRVGDIDGLRAVAMTMVIAQHCGLLPFGWIGVWVFYVISGYVITRGFITEDSIFPYISKFERFKSFLKRRAIRIFPAYFGYIFLTIITYTLLKGSFSGFDYWGLLTFTYNWQMILGPIIADHSWPGIGHLWTLSVEQQFYLFFPILFLYLPAKIRWHVVLAFVLAGPLIRYLYDIVFVIPNFSDNIGHSAFAIYASSFCHFDAFLVGALLAKHEKYLIENAAVRTKIFLLTALSCLAYLSFYIWVNLGLGAKGINVLRNIVSGILYGQERQLWLYSVINLATFCVFLLIFTKSSLVNWLGSKWVSWVGKVSYGGYLLHILVLWILPEALGLKLGDGSIAAKLLNFVVVWVITVSLAGISFKYYETRISKKLKKWATPYS